MTSWPLASFLGTDVHQRTKLLTHTAPCLGRPSKGLTGLGALVSVVVLSILVFPRRTNSNPSIVMLKEVLGLSVLMGLCVFFFPAVSV